MEKKTLPPPLLPPPPRSPLACTQTLFYFSFPSFQKHRRAPLCWRSINPALQFIFYHLRSTSVRETSARLTLKRK